jgi:hypothetical protein
LIQSWERANHAGLIKALARVEATSEDSRYPIKAAFEEDGNGWRAVEVGEQTIKLSSA